MKLKLNVWRQQSNAAKGSLKSYDVEDVSTEMSFLEMLDVLNEKLILKGDEPIAFDHDCREGICGSCSMMINGRPHGPDKGTTACQLHMRRFKEGDEITVEPWRAKAFPVVKDLVVDRSAFDRIIQKGGFISVNTGGAPDANALPIPKMDADRAMDGAACIGCGACVAACKNASAMLFLSAKVGHLTALPQGKVEATVRAREMVLQMDREGFGHCTNQLECEAVCPKEISADFISMVNHLFVKGSLLDEERAVKAGGE